MRTTVTIDDELFRQLKARSAATGKTITQIVEDSLRETLGRRPKPRKERIVLPTDKGGVLLPGVDLDDSASLLDIMEGRRAPS